MLTDTKPARIQRKRTAGWRRGDAVIVDRTSRFGNPFTVQDAVEAGHSHPQVACVMHFRAWVNGSLDYTDVYEVGGRTYDRRRILADLHLLRGRDLACPCDPPEPGETDWCHARVLIDLSNTPGAAL